MNGKLSARTTLLLLLSFVRSWSFEVTRRTWTESIVSSVLSEMDPEEQSVGIRYSDTWTGTRLSVMNIEEASSMNTWSMARWPDPVLRRPADTVADKWFGTSQLQRVCTLLKSVCLRHRAVGLAAQQCAINARIIYLRNQPMFVNPHIVQRSPEVDMKVWRELCLVLPPDFRATVLRDAWVDVEYQDTYGNTRVKRLKGEPARAMQHECDHDRGILITDHVDLADLANDIMREIETPGHEQRMESAYTRYYG